jgi:hypothetical protein
MDMDYLTLLISSGWQIAIFIALYNWAARNAGPITGVLLCRL